MRHETIRMILLGAIVIVLGLVVYAYFATKKKKDAPTANPLATAGAELGFLSQVPGLNLMVPTGMN